MELTINSTTLRNALKLISPAILPSPVMPILANIKCEVFEEGKIILTGSNNRLTIKKTINGASKESFAVLLPFKKLLNICSALPEQPINIIFGKEIVITTGIEKYKIGLSGELRDYPAEVEFLETTSLLIDHDFLSAFYLSKNCVVKEESSLLFKNFVCVAVKNKNVFIMSTDGHQFMRYKKEIETDVQFRCLVDTDFIKATDAINTGGTSNIIINNKYIRIEGKDITITGILSEQVFPDVDIFFVDKNYNVSFKRKEMLAAINGIMVFEKPFYVCSLTFKKNLLEINYDDDFMEEHFNTNVAAEHTVEIDSIDLNIKYLRNILMMMEGEENVYMQVQAVNKFVRIGSDNEDYNFILMPYFKP